MPVRTLVLCGPSGVGKSTIVEIIKKAFPDVFKFSVSHTTRKPRAGEVDGVSYHFVDQEIMPKLIEDDKFLEHATFSGNTYGTSKAAVQSIVEQGKICILDIDMQGVIQIKKTDLNPLYVFIKPPSMEVLEKRLRGRKTENEENIQKRLSAAAAEIEYGEAKGNFDLIIVNDNIEVAGNEMINFLKPFVEELQKDQQ